MTTCYWLCLELAAAAARSTAALRGVTGGGGGLRGGLVARLQLHETVAHMARVTLVSAAQEQPGELLLTDRYTSWQVLHPVRRTNERIVQIDHPSASLDIECVIVKGF